MDYSDFILFDAVVSKGFYWDAWRHIVHILSGFHVADSAQSYT